MATQTQVGTSSVKENLRTAAQHGPEVSSARPARAGGPAAPGVAPRGSAVMTTLPRRNTPLHVGLSLADRTPSCHIGRAARLTTRRTRCPPGPAARPSARPSRRTCRRWVAPSPSSRSTSAADPAGPLLRSEPAPTWTSRCTRFFTVLASGTFCRKIRGPDAVRVDHGAAVVPLLLRDAQLAQEVRPRLVPGRRWLHDVAERRRPELRLRAGVGAVQDDLHGGGHSISSRLRRSGRAGGVHAAQLLLQLADLVAQPGGELELQLAGRGRASGR